MNGIVTGKQEKQAGSLVWKSLYKYTFTADDYSWTVYLNQHSNLLDLLNNQTLYIKLNPATRTSKPPSYILGRSIPYASQYLAVPFQVSTGSQDYVTLQWINDSVGSLTVKLRNNDNSLNYYLTSIEFGTLE
ncbi:MAG TPA: hypothetical protein DCW90_08580 [Lachnospiraceae bacterium]|nr:hypothetical protein [Lachnospiraceae bacterium]